MSTSGSTNFSLNRNELIKHAYQIIGALETGESPTNEEYADASRALNMMLKAWQVDGLKLWLLKEAILIPSYGTETYSLGSDHCSLSMNKTEISTAASALDTSIVVDSTSGMTAADYVGIVTDDGTIHWTTVSSVTNSTTFVLTTALDSAAAVDNHVYFYTSKIDRPTQVIDVYRRDYDNRTDTPLIVLTKDEYYTLSDKDIIGTPVNYYYDPQLTASKLKVWPTADATFAKNSVFVVIIKKPFDDMDAGTDDFECPQEWYEAIAYGLAVRLAPMNFYPLKERQFLIQEAEMYKEKAMTPEGGSIFLTP